jgi:hypothetical protein
MAIHIQQMQAALLVATTALVDHQLHCMAISNDHDLPPVTGTCLTWLLCPDGGLQLLLRALHSAAAGEAMLPAACQQLRMGCSPWDQGKSTYRN